MNPLVKQKLMILTRKETAEILGTSIESITLLSEIGILHPIKIGRSFMYSQEDILEFQRLYRDCNLSNRSHAMKSYLLKQNKAQ